MIDFIVFALLIACALAVVRLRSPLFIALALLCVYLFAVDTVGALAGHEVESHPLHVLALVVLGPSASPTRHPPSWLAPAFLAGLPTGALPTALAIVAALGARFAFRRSAKLRPESPLAHRLDRVALAFVSLAALSAVTVVVALLVTYLASV